MKAMSKSELAAKAGISIIRTYLKETVSTPKRPFPMSYLCIIRETL